MLILIPILFKSKIEAVVKEKVNESVYATVDWSRLSLSLFRGFPDLSVNLHQLSVVGLDDFQGDTLLILKRFELRVNPFSAFRKDLQVKSILLDQPLINGLVLEDGRTNWDIAREDTEEEVAVSEDEDDGSMNISLEKFAIRDGGIYYSDAMMGAEAAMETVNLNLSGDFSASETDLILSLGIDGLDARLGGIPYMKKGTVEVDLQVYADLLENRYTIKENEIKINELVLGTEGQVVLLEDDAMDVDIRFFSRKTSFQTLLSLVPAIYLNDFSSIETKGALVLEGDVSGLMKDSLMPDAHIKLQVEDGYFSYPDLPGDLSDVQIHLEVDYNGSNMDLTTVDLEKFHFLLDGNPFDAQMHVDHPISDMHVVGALEGMVDFSSLKDVLPLEDLKLEGRMTADLKVDTRMSYIEKEQYEDVNLEGLFLVEGVQLVTPDILVPVELTRLELLFNPRFVDLKGADLVLGASDLHLDGALSNFIPYVFKGETISGKLNLSSNLLDVDELLPETEAEIADSASISVEAHPDSLDALTALVIPENLDFGIGMDMKKIIYDGITMEQVQGSVIVRDGIADLSGLELDVIGGHVKLKGRVDTRGEETLADLVLDIKNIDIPTAYSTFVTVERLAPMAKYCKGNANVLLEFSSIIDASLSPVYESISADGRIFTKGVQIYNMSSFVRLSELLKSEKFREMVPNDMNIKFRVRDGNVLIDPFDVKADDSKITVSGLHGIDMSLDYLLDMNIAKSDLGSGAVEVMDGISALAQSAGFKIPESEYIKIKARIKGTFEDPQISTDLSSNLASGKQEVKKMVEERVAEEVQKVEEEVREEASEKADEILKEAEEEVARIMEEAKKAGEQLVGEAEKQGENLVKEAGSNPLKKFAANKAAEELVRQANKQSENLINEAQVKADEIMEKAREEAARI